MTTTDVQAAAANYLTRTGNSDLLAMLGLAEVRKHTANGRNLCPTCLKPLAVDGRKVCRRKACPAASNAALVARIRKLARDGMRDGEIGEQVGLSRSHVAGLRRKHSIGGQRRGAPSTAGAR